MDVVLKIFKQMFEHSLGVFAFDHQSGSMLCRVLEMAAQLLQKYYISLFLNPHSASLEREQEQRLDAYFRRLREVFVRPLHNKLWGVRLLVALPGTLGTLTELMAAWNVALLAPIGGYEAATLVAWRKPWERIIDTCGAELALTAEQRALVRFVDGVDECVAVLKERAGK